MRGTAWSLGRRNVRPANVGVVAGRRYYSPGLGRWVSRDPLGEHGGVLTRGSRRRGEATDTTPAGPAGHPTPGDFLFADNSPAVQVDVLGLCAQCSGGRPQGVGSTCCPACEVRDLTRELNTVDRILANYLANRPADTGFPGGTYRVAYTRCDPINLWNPRAGNPRTAYPQSGMETCRGTCIVEHEEVHRRQCIHQYLSFNWAGGYAATYDQEQAMELPAYGREKSCLRAMLSMADMAARSSGSMRQACICCRRRQLSE
jgi:hypothetical protein